LRLPRGHYYERGFPVRSAGPTPRIRWEEWTFSIQGAGTEARSWTRDATLAQQPALSGKPAKGCSMNAPQTYDAGFSHQIGRYSDAIRVPTDYDQIVVSGTPGLDENGNIPADFADEARQAWRNVAAILEKAGASISDIVSIRQYLTREEDIKTYVAVQKEMITHEPAGMLLVPTAMVWPEIHVEVEAVALVPSGR
jgi:2-iminobutanoate/2-iminopropanoate deaminase